MGRDPPDSDTGEVTSSVPSHRVRAARARRVQSRLVVESGVERGVPAGGCIRGLRPSVSRLKIAGTPAARQGGLKGVIVRIGVVGKDLETVVAVNAGIV